MNIVIEVQTYNDLKEGVFFMNFLANFFDH